MSFAQWIANSGLLSSSAATSLSAPTGRAVDDWLALLSETANETIPNDADFTEIDPPGQVGIGTAGDAAATRAGVVTRWATNDAVDNASCGDPGNHRIAIMTAYRGVPTADPYGMVAYGGTLAGPGTQFTIPGGTTGWSDCKILYFITTPQDTTNSILSSLTNADLANIAERFDDGGTAGNGGTVHIIEGEKATAGAFGEATINLGVSVANVAYIVVALKSATSTEAGGGGEVTGDLDASLAALTFDGAGEVPIAGDLAANLAALTMAAAGEVPITGTMALQLAALTADLAGDVPITGVLDATLASLTFSGAAELPITGALALQLAPLGFDATGGAGDEPIEGDLAFDLAPLAFDAAGDVPIDGALGASLSPLTMSAAGVAPVGGALSLQLAALTFQGASESTITGVLSAQLAALTFAGEGFAGQQATPISGPHRTTIAAGRSGTTIASGRHSTAIGAGSAGTTLSGAGTSTSIVPGRSRTELSD